METQQNLLKGSAYVLLAFFFMAVFGVLTKIASANGSPLWISFISYLSGTVAMIPFLYKKGIDHLKSEHYLYHIMRGTFGLGASFLYTIAMQNINIVNATLLFNTTPLFIPLLSVFWLKLKVTKSTWLAVALGFIGVLVIIKPDASLFTHWGNLIGLASGISLAVAYLTIKILTATDPSSRIIFYYLFIGTIIQLPLLIFAGTLPSWQDCVLACLAGISLLLAQTMLVEGYRYGDASELGIYQYTSVIFVGIISWFIWGLLPPASDIIGVILVALAGIIIIRSVNHKQLGKRA